MSLIWTDPDRASAIFYWPNFGALSPRAKLLLVVLAGYADQGGGSIRVGLVKLGRALHTDPRNVRRALSDLERRGFLVTEAHGRQHSPSTRRLIIPEGVRTTPAENPEGVTATPTENPEGVKPDRQRGSNRTASGGQTGPPEGVRTTPRSVLIQVRSKYDPGRSRAREGAARSNTHPPNTRERDGWSHLSRRYVCAECGDVHEQRPGEPAVCPGASAPEPAASLPPAAELYETFRSEAARLGRGSLPLVARPIEYMAACELIQRYPDAAHRARLVDAYLSSEHRPLRAQPATVGQLCKWASWLETQAAPAYESDEEFIAKLEAQTTILGTVQGG